MSNSRILLFGGTFDPIHNGHLLMAYTVAAALKMEKIILIPSAQPPHKDNIQVTPAWMRLQMCQSAIYQQHLFEVSDCEVTRNVPSYTYDTVAYLHSQSLSCVEFSFLIGADTVPELPTWYRITDFVKICNFVIASRDGYPGYTDLAPLEPILDSEDLIRLRNGYITTPKICISSTQIRNKVKKGESIFSLVPLSVANFIQSHNLYAD